MGKGVIEMINLTKSNAEEIFSHGGVQVIEFYSPTCTHCKRTESGIKEIEEGTAYDAKFIKCDYTQEQALGEKYDVTALPTLIFLKNGEIKNKLTGFTHKLVIEDNLSRI